MKETIEEFIKRGGKVEIIPTRKELEQQKQYIKLNNTPLTLSHGQDLYSEKNKKKPSTKEVSDEKS